MQRTVGCLCLCALLLCLPAPVLGQATGAINGQVTDESGGALPGVTVELDERGHRVGAHGGERQRRVLLVAADRSPAATRCGPRCRAFARA